MITLTEQVLGHSITVTAARAGGDWTVSVLGGCAPHVGSVSLAEWEHGAVTLRTLTRESHKDQLVGDQFARILAEKLQCTVCVICGIHYDGPGPDELRRIVLCTQALLSQLLLKISN